MGGRGRAVEGVELNGAWLDRLTRVTSAAGAEILATQVEAAISVPHGGETPREVVNRLLTIASRTYCMGMRM